MNLLGFRGDWETVEYRELAELIAGGAVPTTGQLVRDVRLVIRIEVSDLDTRLGLMDPDDVLLGAVIVPAAATAGNTSLADLIADINTALSTTVDSALPAALQRLRDGPRCVTACSCWWERSRSRSRAPRGT